MIKLAKNKYGLTLSRLIKVYIIEGTLEEQRQAKATVTQPTGTLTTPPLILLTTYPFTPVHTAPISTYTTPAPI
jgi:hypothetical protein